MDINFEVKKCESCGNKFNFKRKTTGRPIKYCSEGCKRLAKIEKTSEGQEKKLELKRKDKKENELILKFSNLDIKTKEQLLGDILNIYQEKNILIENIINSSQFEAKVRSMIKEFHTH